MHANDNLYSLMDCASTQLEKITCALATHIENAGFELEKYRYKVFNDFYNEAVALEIDSVKQIRELFYQSQNDILDILKRVKAEEPSTSRMAMKLAEMKAGLDRLVIHMANIREIHSVADTIIIPEPKSTLYAAFSGFGKILDQHKHIHWDSENAFESIIYSFFNSSIGVFEQLCIEYDTMLHQIGMELDERQECLKTNSANEFSKMHGIPIRKGTGESIKDIGLAATKLGIAVAETVGIKTGDKNVFDVVVAGVGLLAAISESMGPPPEENKSLGRQLLKKAESYSKSLEMAETIVGDNLPASASAATKLFIGAKLLVDNNYGKTVDLDHIVDVAGFVGSLAEVAVQVINPLKTPKSTYVLLKNGLKAMHHGLNLIEARAEKSCNDSPTRSCGTLQKNNTSLKEYENQTQLYNLQKQKYGFAKRTKPPPGVKAIHFIHLTYDILDVFS